MLQSKLLLLLCGLLLSVLFGTLSGILSLLLFGASFLPTFCSTSIILIVFYLGVFFCIGKKSLIDFGGDD